MRSLLSLLDTSDRRAAERLPPAPVWSELAELASLAEERVRLLRNERGGLRAAMDERLRSVRTEVLEQPHTDPGGAQRILQALHYGNAATGSYRRIASLVGEELPVGGSILELAAGHGGLSLHLADQGYAVTSSEHDHDLVEAIRQRAMGSGRDLQAVQLDATRLDAVDADSVDVVLMVQAARHFSPGQLAVLVASARRIARRAVVLVCGRRGLTSLGAFTSAGLLIPGAGRSFVHAARKIYSEEELRTLVTLASEQDAVHVVRTAPGQVSLVVRRARV
ncbi:MAG: class I SAM-dependent methyltransferase [Proteobacteria bacterium]|nr:class I SAM-dependent methyltransferase [Pseudomonadota bacterium]